MRSIMPRIQILFLVDTLENRECSASIRDVGLCFEIQITEWHGQISIEAFLEPDLSSPGYTAENVQGNLSRIIDQ